MKSSEKVKFTEKDLIKVTSGGLGDGNKLVEQLIFFLAIFSGVLFIALILVQELNL